MHSAVNDLKDTFAQASGGGLRAASGDEKEALLKFAAKKKWKPLDEGKLDEAVDDHLVREKPLRQVFMDVFPLSTREQDEEQDEI